MAMAITANLLTIELIHRLLVVLYEVCFTLQGGTPGKRTMGLSIISCTKCIPVGMYTSSLLHLLKCIEDYILFVYRRKSSARATCNESHILEISRSSIPEEYGHSHSVSHFPPINGCST
jgi:hypothetical protein